MANRLLGEKINVEERHSTEGIALHRIESTFNTTEMKGGKWEKKELNFEDLKRDLGQGLVAILQKGGKTTSESTAMGEIPRPQEAIGPLHKKVKEDLKTSESTGMGERPRPQETIEPLHEKVKEDLKTSESTGKGERPRPQETIEPLYEKVKEDVKTSESTGMGERPRPQETIEPLHEKVKEDVKISPVPKSSALKKMSAQEEQFSSLLDNKEKKKMITLRQKPSKQDSEESTWFSISLWDLGGQDEFISTHHLFLNIDATILIVMDITKELYELIGSNFQFGYLNSAVDVLHYWLNFFHNKLEEKINKEKNPQLNIGLVLTHKDKIQEKNRDEYVEDYKTQILEAVKDKPYSKYLTREKIYVVDNTEETEENFGKLRDDLLKHVENQKSWGKKMPLPWFSLKADIIEQPDRKFIDLEHVWKLAEKYGMNPQKVESFLKMQTTLGDFVYFQELREIVITDPGWLVDKCSALISAHKFIDQRKGL